MLSLREFASMVGVVGSYSSIIALFITIWIIGSFRRMKREFLFQARSPELMQKLSSHRSELSSLLNTYPASQDDIAVELRRCQATLQNLNSMLNRKKKTSMKKVLKKVKNSASTKNSVYKEQVREVYLDLVLLEEELHNLSQDYRWGPRK